MQWAVAWLCVFAAASVTCNVKCPDGNVCSDTSTCCQTHHGYSCCPYPTAVCCPDLAHCCPPGFRCDQRTQMCERVSMPWENTPLMRREGGGSRRPHSHSHPSHSHPEGLSKARVTPLTQAVREAAVIRCDSEFFCSPGYSCCKKAEGQWSCCPYPLATCCLDGVHCCEYGYTCDPSSSQCRGFYSRVPSGRHQPAQRDRGGS